jgi:hypothetical protein
MLMALIALVAIPVHAAIVSCAANGSGGDLVDRGFYVQNYPIGSLGAVTMQYIGGSVGSYTVTLTATAGAYGGPPIGAITTSFSVTNTGGDTPVTFDFGNAPVVPGSTIAFKQTLVSGPGALFMDIGNGALGVMDNTCPGVFETEGTTPPLDVFRRNSVALAINPSVPAVVPTLGNWTLILLAFVLTCFAALRLRRS